MNKETLLKGMNEIVMATTDENLIDTWLIIIPDGADDEDFQEIVNDPELFATAVKQFIALSKYFKHGLVIDGKLYR